MRGGYKTYFRHKVSKRNNTQLTVDCLGREEIAANLSEGNAGQEGAICSNVNVEREKGDGENTKSSVVESGKGRFGSCERSREQKFRTYRNNVWEKVEQMFGEFKESMYNRGAPKPGGLLGWRLIAKIWSASCHRVGGIDAKGGELTASRRRGFRERVWSLRSPGSGRRGSLTRRLGS